MHFVTPCFGRARARIFFAAFALFLSSVLAAPAFAATYYVRADGGDANQCTGRANTAYSGTGTNQACAWKHPFIALPPASSARIAGGDTLIVASGSYMMGLGAPGAALCNAAWSYECHMAPIPSGPSPSQPTRILGQGHDANCPSPPELWGTERSSLVLNLQGSSNVEVGCFEITDHEACIESHCHNGQCQGEVARCKRDAAPFGKWAGTGISARDSSRVTLRDVNVHGMANRGVMAGRLSDWTTERLTIRANGWAGWDGDLNGANSSNSGTLTFKELDVSWNGCAERYPSTEIFGCWGQGGGGYGDGMGTGATGGHWVFEDSTFHHNTSDGLDLLYMSSGSVTIRRTWAEGNAGNQLKTKGDATIENSVIVGNCAYFSGERNMQNGDNCRALGNAVSVAMGPTSVVNIVNNTITSQGDCLVLSGGGGAGAKLNFVNNLMAGEVDWRQTWERSCAHYSDGGSEQVTWDHNFVTGVKNNYCPPGSLCAGLPMIASLVSATFDATPLVGSPLIDAANSSKAPATDYYGRAREPGRADIGAVELGGGPVGGGATPPAGAKVFSNGFDD